MGVVNRFRQAGAGRDNIELFTRSKWAIDGVIVTATAEQLNSASAGLVYRGAWNANTNTPTLVSGEGIAGDFYIVSVAGNTDLDGNTNWVVGDWAIFNGTVWEQISSNTGALLIANALNELFTAGLLNTANSNLGSFGPGVSVNIASDATYTITNPMPKRMYITAGNNNCTIKLPAANAATSPNGFQGQFSLWINQSSVDIAVVAADGSTPAGTLGAGNGLLVSNDSNTTTNGGFVLSDFITPAYIAANYQAVSTDTVQTTNATWTAITSIPVPENSSVKAKISVLGKRSGGLTYAWADFVITATRTTGDAEQSGTLLIDKDSSSTEDARVSIDTGTQSILVEVKGISAQTYNWSSEYSTQIINS